MQHWWSPKIADIPALPWRDLMGRFRQECALEAPGGDENLAGICIAQAAPASFTDLFLEQLFCIPFLSWWMLKLVTARQILIQPDCLSDITLIVMSGNKLYQLTQSQFPPVRAAEGGNQRLLYSFPESNSLSLYDAHSSAPWGKRNTNVRTVSSPSRNHNLILK